LQHDLVSKRGHIAAAARRVVEQQYNLKESDVPQRKELIRRLLNPDRQVYLIDPKHLNLPDPPLYTHPAISAVLIEQYFRTRSGWGIRHPAVRANISLYTIALVATALWAALKQWESGVYDKTASLANLRAEAVYLVHIEQLSRRAYDLILQLHDRPIRDVQRRLLAMTNTLDIPHFNAPSAAETAALQAILNV